MTRPSVVLADDHAIVLDGLRRILEPEFRLVGTAVDGRTFIEQVLQHKPDVAIADIAMPLLNGLDALRQLKNNTDVATRFVILTASPDASLAIQAFRLGAHAYVVKQSASDELVTAIRFALREQTYIAPLIANEVLSALMRGGQEERPLLTPREREVLQLLAEGRSAKEIATILSLSVRTIEFHRQNITEKTGLRTIAELSRYAARQGLVDGTN